MFITLGTVLFQNVTFTTRKQKSRFTNFYYYQAAS